MKESTTSGEIIEAIVKDSKCNFTEIKVSGIRVNGNGMATAWVKCPIATANKITERGEIKVGWVKVKTVMLKARSLQCYKCLQFGHVRQYCKEKEDNRDRCYRCGQRGQVYGKNTKFRM